MSRKGVMFVNDCMYEIFLFHSWVCDATLIDKIFLGKDDVRVLLCLIWVLRCQDGFSREGDV